PKPAVFSRALALVGVSSSEAQRSSPPTRSRAEERSMKSSEMPAEKVSAPQAVDTFPQPVNAVKRIPYDPDLYVPENRAIPCALTRRFVSDVAGKLECVLTEDVYSASGNTRLIDKGTVAHLDYKTGTLMHGQGRAFLIVSKLRTRQPP
ncbi:putative TriI protein, partial [Serratia symbiotica str. Tucson]